MTRTTSVHIVGMVEANMKESLTHEILQHDDVAHFDDMDGDVASFGDMTLLPRGG